MWDAKNGGESLRGQVLVEATATRSPLTKNMYAFSVFARNRGHPLDNQIVCADTVGKKGGRASWATIATWRMLPRGRLAVQARWMLPRGRLAPH